MGSRQEEQFNRNRNKEKALNHLLGILRGVTADSLLVREEVDYLNAWLLDDAINKNDGDFLDIADAISDVIADKRITKKEHADLMRLIKDVIKYNNIDSATDEAETNHFIGFLSGIAADDKIKEQELQVLGRMLSSSFHLRSSVIGGVLLPFVLTALSHSPANAADLDALLTTIKRTAGAFFVDTGHAINEPITLNNDRQITSISGLTICFTGEFSIKRNILRGIAENLGATPVERVTQNLGVLVVGGDASENWRFSNHGRKIETVMKNIKNGSKTELINELQWNKLVELAD